MVSAGRSSAGLESSSGLRQAIKLSLLLLGCLLGPAVALHAQAGEVLKASRSVEDEREARFHDLRHEWASRFVENLGDLGSLMRIGGWSSLKMVERYAISNRQAARRVMELGVASFALDIAGAWKGDQVIGGVSKAKVEHRQRKQ